MSQKSKKSEIDIYQLLLDTEEKEDRKQREELLAPLEIKEFFSDGSININKQTCQGIDCRLCLEVCPTNALYWKFGEVGIVVELCVYCGACVLSCIVEDCIKVHRKRKTGEIERFSNSRDFLRLQRCISVKKRFERVRDNYLLNYIRTHPTPIVDIFIELWCA